VAKGGFFHAFDACTSAGWGQIQELQT
jgi:hypothetical protein